MNANIRPVWAEIDLDAIAHNMKEVKTLLKDKEIIAVIKADAYGHGAIDVAPVLLENGATKLAVAVITEAMELRHVGIDAPIMILGYTPIDFAKELIENDIEQSVYSLDYAKELSEEALRRGKKAKIHIVIDTGMGRLGFLPNEESFKEVLEICSLGGLQVEGIFTHFASSDEEDKEYTHEQLRKLQEFCNKLSLEGININIKHAANSGAIVDLPETYLDGVRAGILLYGYYPSHDVDMKKIDLKPALTLKTKVAYVKKLDKDMYISYGRTFKTERESIIATLPIGYADGYSRLLSGKVQVIINGKLANVVGRICMDQCMIDVTDIGEVKVDDEVILLGQYGDLNLDADYIADMMGTVNYEVICMIKQRVPRVYIKNGEITKIRNYF
ncbi:alanine racemase [Clostridium hydrogeniformans]|uniref:alanine racemase n=1 Tax=Clostridium hydrogeniformans TaxID=349933 RepID=UPI00048333C7|nr:alanine racemase [Clostridium hydrogeniformans]